MIGQDVGLCYGAVMVKAIPIAALFVSVLSSGALAQPEVAVAGITFPGTITDDQWKIFQANVQEQADPPLSLKMMIRGEAGSEEMMIQAARRGRIQLAAPSTAGSASLVPELAVLQLPFLFDSTDQMDAIYDSVLPDYFRGAFAERGLVFLHWIDSGWLGFYGQESYADPSAAEGVKLRTAPTEAARLIAQSLNADAIYVPYPEIVQSLQTGLIEGGMTSDYAFVTGGIAPETKVFTLTKHGYDTGMMLANGEWYEALSSTNKKMFLSAYGDTSDFRTRSRAYSTQALADLDENGVTRVVALSSHQRERWMSATKMTHQLLLDRIGPDAVALYDLITDAKSHFDQGKG